MNPAVFKNQVSAAPTANTEKKDAREVARAFQCARLISYYLKLDKQVVLSPVWQQAPSVYKLLSSKTSELSNLNDITARPISILKDNFMEEFKYLLSNPTILHPLRQGVVQHIPPQFEQGTAALFSRLDKLLQYLTREIVAA